MLKLTAIHTGPARPLRSLTLPFGRRTKTRQRVTLDDGVEAGLFLPRGTVLRAGTRLSDGAGTVVEVRAAPEPVSTVRTDDPTLLARVSYHLGNRHVPLEIGPGYVRYRRDHVLDGMVEALGLQIEAEEAPFEPEAGAYDVGGAHAHDHGHDT